MGEGICGVWNLGWDKFWQAVMPSKAVIFSRTTVLCSLWPGNQLKYWEVSRPQLQVGKPNATASLKGAVWGMTCFSSQNKPRPFLQVRLFIGSSFTIPVCLISLSVMFSPPHTHTACSAAMAHSNNANSRCSWIAHSWALHAAKRGDQGRVQAAPRGFGRKHSSKSTQFFIHSHSVNPVWQMKVIPKTNMTQMKEIYFLRTLVWSLVCQPARLPVQDQLGCDKHIFSSRTTQLPTLIYLFRRFKRRTL